MTTGHYFCITYYPGVWKDTVCSSPPNLQLNAAGNMILCIGAKYLSTSPFFRTLLELDRRVETKTSSKVELKLVSATLRDLPPTEAMDLVKVVLFANYDWKGSHGDLLTLIHQPDAKLYPIVFLALYFCSEQVREKIYVHVANLVQRTLTTKETPTSDTIAILELLLDQNHCFEWESPKDLSVLVQHGLCSTPTIRNKLARNLQNTLGSEKSLCLLLRTCKHLVTQNALPKRRIRNRELSPSSRKTAGNYRKRRRNNYLLNGNNPYLSVTDED